MDIDLFKSVSADEQMDMLMMMQMGEKLPGYGGDLGGGDTEYSGEYSGSSSGGRYCNLPPHATQNAGAPAFTNLPSTISFGGGAGRLDAGPADRQFLSGPNAFPSAAQKRSSMAAMREMIFRIAVMQPIQIDPETVKPPKRRNVKISKDPQSVAARHRRERISERIRILQRLVPGGTKMDTASMLDEAIHYVKFLKSQVQSLERVGVNRPTGMTGVGFPVAMSNGSYIGKASNYQGGAQMVQQQYCDAN